MPDVAGVKENKGCPAETKRYDKDGVNDSDDKCPSIAGTAVTTDALYRILMADG